MIFSRDENTNRDKYAQMRHVDSVPDASSATITSGKGFPLLAGDPVVRATSPSSTAIKSSWGISRESCGGPNRPFSEVLLPRKSCLNLHLLASS